MDGSEEWIHAGVLLWQFE